MTEDARLLREYRLAEAYLTSLEQLVVAQQVREKLDGVRYENLDVHAIPTILRTAKERCTRLKRRENVNPEILERLFSRLFAVECQLGLVEITGGIMTERK